MDYDDCFKNFETTFETIAWGIKMKKTHVFDPKNAATLEEEARRVWQNPEKILGNVEIRSDFIAADLGCGSGFFTVPLSYRVKRIYAIDIQEEMLKIFKRKIKRLDIRNIVLLLSKENEIPLEDESVDLLISINTLHEFDDKERIIDEMKRAIKQSGTVLIADFMKKDTGFGPPVEVRVSKDHAIDLFEKKGLVVLKTQDLMYHYSLVFSKRSNKSY